MEFMGLNEIREKYLSFFESKGHLRMESFPLVPQNDKSILLINAGMTPLKPYFTGQQTPPRNRVTTCQKCIRTPDIERVGKTSRHGTFFEMLGNFSFGDYFKHEATAWAWEFVTQVMKLPVDRLHVTVYQDDDEAYDIWTKEIGVDPSHVSRLGKADNFWEHGSGPCGPCSEIYFDRGPEKGCGSPDCKVGCDCDRFVEFWNLVFTQFDNDGNGNYSQLEKKNIDTGMGLERLACIMQGVDSLFDVDTIKNITARLSEMSAKKYGDSPETDVSLRVVTDHIRSTTFMVCDGVLPSNEGRGYVLRRLLRRAARHGKLLGIKDSHFLCELVDVVIRESGNAYPDLIEKADYIKKVIENEENSFNQTIDRGLNLLSDIIDKLSAEGKTVLSGEDAFKLYDTFGFPLDLTLEILEEKGMTVDEDGYNALMKEQKEKARAARGNDTAWKGDETLEGLAKTEFTGYTSIKENAEILALVINNERVSEAFTGAEVQIVLNKTPFYGESGGQVGDKGTLTKGKTVIKINDVKRVNGIFVHYGTVESGKITVSDTVKAVVCKENREAIMRNHSSVHLLQSALREVLGTHVAQAGSYVDANRARFDFSHFEAMTAEQVAKVEKIVNSHIFEAIPVVKKEMSIEDAKKTGALALFGEKYGETVRVVKMGKVSTELCGGTHVKNTGMLGCFKILSETGISAGVRRIEAITGTNVLDYIDEKNAVIAKTAQAFKCNVNDIAAKAEQNVAELKAAEKQIAELNSKIALGALDEILANAEKTDKFTIVTGILNAKADVLREMCDKVKEKDENAVVLLASDDKETGKVSFACACGKAAVKNGAHAGNIVKKAAVICGGGGGGRPDSATAGGKDSSKIEQALAEAAASVK
ncbi:MAG: alanine--tRNA ligase [Clostridia bacterium]|nr:alanine--tRNA ligase [Clostridia bacterium]